jgi:NADPH:quinone reductase-like Zn-dependent oxidoreductase
MATAASADLEYVRGLGAERTLDYQTERFEESLTGVDVVLDTVGGDTQQRSLRVLKPGGILVSVVSPVPETMQKQYGVRSAYFYVDVTTARLNKITELFDSGKLVTAIGTVLPLEDCAHCPRDACRPPASPRKDRARYLLLPSRPLRYLRKADVYFVLLD